MATARIRYTELGQKGLFESVKKFQHPQDGSRYYVLIDDTKYEWKIIEENSELTAASGSINPNKAFAANIARTEARQALVALGIVLDVEQRAKKNKE